MRHNLTSVSSSLTGKHQYLSMVNGSDSAYLSMRSDEDSAPPPPRIAPVSGVLSVKAETVLRPIACKPPIRVVRLSSRSNGSPASSLPSSSPSPSPWDRNSPSLSSGVGLDSILRDKEAEIANLRQTLEHNEQVIFKVYAEKEQDRIREIHHLHQQYETKLQACQQRHVTLTSQIKKENEHLETELEQMRRDYEKSQKQVKQLQEELSNSRTQLEETQWNLCHKSGEIALLKSQLRDCQGGNASRVTELFTLRNKLKELQIQTKEKDQRISELNTAQETYNGRLRIHRLSEEHLARHRIEKAIEEKSRESSSEMDQIRTELYVARQNLQLMQQNMEEERTQWENEKERVICYQKRLQMTYLQMCQRNKLLESEVHKLVLELENKAGESQC